MNSFQIGDRVRMLPELWEAKKFKDGNPIPDGLKSIITSSGNNMVITKVDSGSTNVYKYFCNHYHYTYFFAEDLEQIFPAKKVQDVELMDLLKGR